MISRFGCIEESGLPRKLIASRRCFFLLSVSLYDVVDIEEAVLLVLVLLLFTHCLPPMGLHQRQKNQGEEEGQVRVVRGEPSLCIVPRLGKLDKQASWASSLGLFRLTSKKLRGSKTSHIFYCL